ncbi:MAG: hypothetical protein OXO48_12860 [Caldilineaceae bacterium]|nr:hypothetical protein [Caldilineaceae bacterium]
MTQFAIIDRFCAIENTFCRKKIPFNGSWTFFFAYPSNPKMQDHTAKLVNQLKNRGIGGVRWEDVVSNDLLFTKVCEEIHSSAFLLAEVTEPNLNVLLEVGYALAVGRQPLLLQNKNQKTWTRDLLSTLESCFYATREDICEHISRWQARSPDIYEPNQRLPFLDNMGLYDHQEVRGTTYHLKPRVSTDWISRVDRSFDNSPFKLTLMDPSDSVYDDFFTQARQIQRASLIVASFVSTDYIDWEENSAKVALLTGFAIGLGKQVLVLQEKPTASILDLGSVSRPFETEEQAQKIVDAWIDKQVKISVSQAVESQQQASSRQQADLLRHIYLGHPDALQDNELQRYFVQTKEYDDAIKGQRTIIVGRRGSGKSANFQAIKEEITKQSNTVSVEILPDDFQLERVKIFLEDATDLPDPRFIFQSIWNYVLTTEILKALAEKTDWLYYSPDDVSRNYLRSFYDSEYDRLALDFGRRVVLVLESIKPSSPDMTVEERRLNAEEALKELRNYDLGRRLKEFAKDERISFFVVADDLDKHWLANTTQSIDLLLGLIEEVAKMQRFFGTYLKIVLFLREDIYDVLARFDDDFSKRDILRMEWTPSNLHHLVAARLATRFDGQGDEEIWSAIFPEPVENIAASQYILDKSLPRPREVLNLCQKAIDHAQRNGHPYVTARDVLDGEKSYSEALFNSVCSEFKGLYPKLEEVLLEFAGASAKIPWHDFEEIAASAIQKNMAIVVKWGDEKDITPNFLAEVLFKIGLIGLSREWTSPVHFCNGRSFSETWRLVSSNPVFHIHPAFAQFLETSEAGLRPPRRSSQRRRKVSPMQMSFDDEFN